MDKDDHLSKMTPSEITLKGHILVAEDNVLNQELLSAMLSRLGCTVDSVFNGYEVLETLNNNYDLILMDCHMPGLDGISTAKRIRTSDEEWSNIPIYAITGDVSESIISHCENAVINGYLSKPFSQQDIVKLLLSSKALTLM